MTLRSYYRWALLLPFVVPMIVAPLAYRTPAGTDLRAVGYILGYSVVLGGLPYAAFVLWQLRRMRDRTDAQLVRAMWLAPLGYAALMTVTALVVILIAGALDEVLLLRVGIATSLYLGAMAVGLGYVYVLLAEAGRLILRRRGCVGPAAG